MGDLFQTPLHALHQELGAKMMPFAGYDMPVHYGLGVMKEHLHTRAKAGLFDVSHMGQITL
ncbi:MAG: glycine cleavage system aminomethyltransferase GcvT, partial [Pseudomonadota bacterium]